MSDKLTPESDIEVRTVTSGTSLHAGTLVYRVIEDDPPPDVRGPHTWKVKGIVVERASDKQIKLQRPFNGLARKVFEPTALGHFFFETPQQARQSFLTERRAEVESLLRKKKEAERALAWAEDACADDKPKNELPSGQASLDQDVPPSEQTSLGGEPCGCLERTPE